MTLDYIISFATILQLIGLYKSEGGSREAKSRDNFIAWLVNHKHNELKEFIVEHSELDSEVTALLQRNHDDVRSDLRILNEITLGIAERIASFSPLAQKANAPELLSKQALQILILFAETDGDEMFLMPLSGEKWPVLQVCSNDKIEKTIGNFNDPRLLNDDLDSLVSCNLLIEGGKTSGLRTLRITRKAISVVEKLNRDELFAD